MWHTSLLRIWFLCIVSDVRCAVRDLACSTSRWMVSRCRHSVQKSAAWMQMRRETWWWPLFINGTSNGTRRWDEKFVRQSNCDSRSWSVSNIRLWLHNWFESNHFLCRCHTLALRNWNQDYGVRRVTRTCNMDQLGSKTYWLAVVLVSRLTNVIVLYSRRTWPFNERMLLLNSRGFTSFCLNLSTTPRGLRPPPPPHPLGWGIGVRGVGVNQRPTFPPPLICHNLS
jgi:hypothetical protein